MRPALAQVGAGIEFAVRLLSRHEQLDVGVPNINGQNFHQLTFCVLERGAIGCNHWQ
jgi:hypothetical protein